MRRLGVILLCSMYLVLSAGIHVHIDKCCDTIQSMLVIQTSDDCCKDVVPEDCCQESGCGDHEGCDRDELHIQFAEEFVPAERSRIDFQFSASEIQSDAKLTLCSVSESNFERDLSDVPIEFKAYLRYTSLLFYG